MVSRTAQYAIRAVSLLAAEPDVNHGASEIAERIDAPPNYTGKILKLLADARVLVSMRGAGGGFSLARRPGEISLYEVVDPIDNLSRWTDCFLGLGECRSDRPCPIHPVWCTVRDQYLDMLKGTMLSDLPLGGGEMSEYRAPYTERNAALDKNATGKNSEVAKQ